MTARPAHSRPCFLTRDGEAGAQLGCGDGETRFYSHPW